MEPCLRELIGREVVLDTQGPLIYLGRLESLTATLLVLTDADVHDRHDGAAGKELYVLQAKEHGIRVNRGKVIVWLHEVASISALDDVTVEDDNV